jgi:hypothetical protein
MLTFIITAAFTYIAMCFVALLAIHRAPIDPIDREEPIDMDGKDKHGQSTQGFLLVLEGHYPHGSLVMRTDPVSAAIAIGVAARMVDSPTPARIVPATPANLDRYPALVDTDRVVQWLIVNRPAPVARWNESSLVSSN